MIDMREIEAAIADLERRDITYSGCAKLADLYAIQDHMRANQLTYGGHSHSGAQEYGESEFLQALKGKDERSAWRIIDELMETLMVVNYRAYDTVMRKLSKL